MAEESTSANERLVELTGRSAGEASATVVELAAALGYSVVATAPGSYRLARTRRKMLVAKQVESVTITISEDRHGTRARVVGPVDESLIEHLGGPTNPTSGLALESRPPPPAAAAPPPTVADAGPAASQPAPPPPPAAPPAPPPPAPPPPRPTSGLITTPSWGQDAAEPSPPPVHVPSPPPAPVRQDPFDDEPDARTVARSALRAEVPTVPSITLPDGRIVPLTSPMVIGRGPDPLRGPPGSVALVIADPSLSKTHAVVESEAGVIWITDLHSTNGTTLEGAGPARTCEPGDRIRLASGTVARFGDVVVTTLGVA